MEVANNNNDDDPQRRHRFNLTPAHKIALREAILSAIRHPDGEIDPDLLQRAISRGLPERAVRNAASVALERDRRNREQRAQLEAQEMSAIETEFEDDGDRRAFKEKRYHSGVSTGCYRTEILPLKNGTSTEFEYDLDETIGDRGRKRIGTFIAGCNSMRELNIRAKDSNTIRYLFRGTTQHSASSLKVFSLINAPLDYSATSGTIRGVSRVIDFLHSAPLLRKVSLEGVSMSNHSLAMLGSALRGKALEHVTLTGNEDTTHDCLRPLVESLDGSIIKSLDFQLYSGGTETCGAIAALVSQPNSALRKVHLESIDTESVQLLCSAISQSKNTTLQSIRLDGNITPEGLESVKNLVCDKSSLDAIHDSNHSIRHFGNGIHMNRYKCSGVDQSNHYVDETDDGRDFWLRCRLKIVTFLTTMGRTIDAFNEIDNPKVMPRALALVGQTPGGGMDSDGSLCSFTLGNLYKVIRHWHMPLLFEYPNVDDLTEQNARLTGELTQLRDELGRLRAENQKLAAENALYRESNAKRPRLE